MGNILVMVKRKILIRIPEKADVERILEEVMAAISAQEAFYRVRGNVLELRITGDPVSVGRSIEAVKRIVSNALPGPLKRGNTVVNLAQSSKTLGYPVPIDSFVYLLSLYKIKNIRKDDELIIEENPDRVREIAAEFFDRLRASRSIAKGKAAELVALLSTFFDALPEDVLEAGKEAGVLEDEDGKARLIVGWEKAVQSISALLEAQEEE